jgi:hypothetical protein
MSFVRAATKATLIGARVPVYRAAPIAIRAFSQSAPAKDQHAEETFEEFTARYDVPARSRGRTGRSGMGDMVPRTLEQALDAIEHAKLHQRDCANLSVIKTDTRRSLTKSTMCSSSRYVTPSHRITCISVGYLGFQ